MRAATLLLTALALISGASSSAYAWDYRPSEPVTTPMITEAAYTNPVASELKSLQWTHFYGTFDRAVWAVLTIHDGTGREVARIFDGSVPEANKRFWFPSWNGKGNAGRYLPSSVAYTWKLRVFRGGYEDVRTGRIAVCRVLFSVRGDTSGSQLANPGALYDRYLVEGAGRAYVRVVDTGTWGKTNFGIAIYNQTTGTHETTVGAWSNVISPLSDSKPFTLASRGVKTINLSVSSGTWYEITFMQ